MFRAGVGGAGVVEDEGADERDVVHRARGMNVVALPSTDRDVCQMEEEEEGNEQEEEKRLRGRKRIRGRKRHGSRLVG